MMKLTRHQTPSGLRWSRDNHLLPQNFTLSLLLELPQSKLAEFLQSLPTEEATEAPLLAPVEPQHEIWACGVTYLRSRDARKAESTVADVYELVYDADRPEIFLKATGWRAVGHNSPVRIRRDSHWNVPEPELVLVINRHLEIVGYCAGSDMSSRDIEGANPLYLPQAKIYDGACALGPGIILAGVEELRDLPITLEIRRQNEPVFQGETSTSQMKRQLEELVAYFGRELAVPQGAFLMTGTGIIPPDSFSLQPGDVVEITVGDCVLVNEVQQ